LSPQQQLITLALLAFNVKTYFTQLCFFLFFREPENIGIRTKQDTGFYTPPRFMSTIKFKNLKFLLRTPRAPVGQGVRGRINPMEF
jgi:hypothetical protein